MTETFGIIDLFAGPGGLAEGLSRAGRDGEAPFRMELSVEMEPSAHSTLRLRSFLRTFEDGRYPQAYFDALNARAPLPDWSHTKYRAHWDQANNEALQLVLGHDDLARSEMDSRIDSLKRRYHGNLGLIGGPPCQAYSLIGRSRNRGKPDYVPEEDKRHYLYQEYIRILTRLEPAFFVMENVKGILSSRVDGGSVFERILEDLRSVRTSGNETYTLIPIAEPDGGRAYTWPRPRDFIVRAEQFGIPQARHRVIVVGIRSDIVLSDMAVSAGLIPPSSSQTSVRTVLGSMPALQSVISRRTASGIEHQAEILDSIAAVRAATLVLGDREITDELELVEARMRGTHAPETSTSAPDRASRSVLQWIENDRLDVYPNHVARSHMPQDLERYLFAAVFAAAKKRSPKAHEFPPALVPNHANWHSGKFSDRFRVQVWDRPSTTITSHMAKDGHYYIHPDPVQCRSLSVREAARLQTFPDDYLFTGNRTQQYVQVGNAVPPYLAKQIGDAILRLLDGNRQPME